MTGQPNPFDEFQRLLSRMRDQFESVPTESWEWPGPSDAAVDLVERDDEFVVTVDVPGFERDDIEVRLSDSTLRIEASRETQREESDERYIRRERGTETVSRSIRLPASPDPEAVTAEYRNGVLTVTLPKTADVSGTEINVE